MPDSNGRWILEWNDRSRDPDRRVLISADGIRETRDAIRRLLTGATWTPADADDLGGALTEPALDAFLREELGDSTDETLSKLWGGITFECDDGVFRIQRER
jgi:hypothetical protein